MPHVSRAYSAKEDEALLVNQMSLSVSLQQVAQQGGKLPTTFSACALPELDTAPAGTAATTFSLELTLILNNLTRFLENKKITSVSGSPFKDSSCPTIPSFTVKSQFT